MTLYVYKYVNTSSLISTGFSNNTAGPIWLVSIWKNLAIDLLITYISHTHLHWNLFIETTSTFVIQNAIYQIFSHLIGPLKTFYSFATIRPKLLPYCVYMKHLHVSVPESRHVSAGSRYRYKYSKHLNTITRYD